MSTKKVIALLLSAVMLLSCISVFAEETDTSENTRLEIGLNGRPEKTEPVHLTVGSTTKVSGSFFSTQFGNNTSDIDVRSMIHGYNTVVWNSQLGYEPDLQVAESIVKSAAATSTIYTVKLQQDLLWNDGTPITAEDYVFSYLLLASPEFAALGANTGVWEHVVGYEEYAAGETDALEGITLIDGSTFSVAVKSEYEPYFYEYSYLAVYPYPIGVIAPGCCVTQTAEGAMIADDSTDEAVQTVFTAGLLETTILGADGYLHMPALTAGPYRLTAYDAESGEVVFEKNDYYKGNSEGVKPWIDTVTLVPVAQSAMLDELQNGSVDVLNKVVSGEIINQGLKLTSEGYAIESYARLGYGFLAFSCEQGPQQFESVRQAIAYCFDTETFTADVLKNYGMPVYGYYGLGQWMTMAASGSLVPETEDSAIAADWEAVTLDNLNHYDLNLEKAEQLLIDDGWVLNASGERFSKDSDTLRYKNADGVLMPLSFDFAQCKDNAGAAYAGKMLSENLAQIGGELVVHEVSFTELLSDYYRENEERQYDINFMATNFVSTFDPYLTLVSSEDHEGAVNTSGLQDAELLALAWKMHETDPDDMLAFLQRWEAFQVRYNEVLPTLPIYSNMYFDFHIDTLQNYMPNAERSWPEAVLYAYIGEPIETPADESEELIFE